MVIKQHDQGSLQKEGPIYGHFPPMSPDPCAFLPFHKLSNFVFTGISDYLTGIENVFQTYKK